MVLCVSELFSNESKGKSASNKMIKKHLKHLSINNQIINMVNMMKLKPYITLKKTN